ncbi:unnamed protein product [Darwinula stevensoni]|uniref:Uncharacterized protein n=1 Tax=Darwinula stevensoni TaxID=69355 RepID=A0A7R8X9H5_9CRUS|nr:unnamed protein product [Darwinula stevensoni]CAG0885587.1 unnamed protein product [Darwinula stevensoni]
MHVVGLGLGSWLLSPAQVQLYLDSFGEVLQELPLAHVADVHFSWIPGNDVAGIRSGEYTRYGVKVHLSKRNAQEKLKGENDGKLLVVSYAWNGNAFPGNDYWMGVLSGTGDPAAAYSSLIPQLHNPLVNQFVDGKHAVVLSPSPESHEPDFIQCQLFLSLPLEREMSPGSLAPVFSRIFNFHADLQQTLRLVHTIEAGEDDLEAVGRPRLLPGLARRGKLNVSR